jgi:hypothetical protein
MGEAENMSEAKTLKEKVKGKALMFDDEMRMAMKRIIDEKW